MKTPSLKCCKVIQEIIFCNELMIFERFDAKMCLEFKLTPPIQILYLKIDYKHVN